MSREFSLKEKIILLILVLILLGFAYYQFVDTPVRDGLARAESETGSLQMELNEVNAKIATLNKMQDEIDDIIASGETSYMPSYNNSKAELRMLNDVLSVTEQYSISFANVTRNGDQVRRDFSLSFTAPSFDVMRGIINRLTGADFRCLIGNLSCSMNKPQDDSAEYGSLAVSMTATFFETMVGGSEDSGLNT